MTQTFGSPLLQRLSDYESHFTDRLAPGEDIYGKVGSSDWQSLTSNVTAFSRIKLRPRVLRGVDQLDLSTTVLHDQISMPIMFAPPGGHTRVHPDGELATARAAGRAETVMAVSTAAGHSIEDIAAVATGPLWFQLYFFEDRRLNERLVRRAEEAGYRAIMVTVSMPPVRSSNTSWNGAELDPQAPGSEGSNWSSKPVSSVQDIEIPSLLQERDLLTETPRLSNFMTLTKSLAWSDLEWLRQVSTLPIIVKGIQTSEDAHISAENGVDGIVVSNHGGYAVEGTLGTVEMLPEIIEAAQGRLEVYLDGGIRTGTDVLKSLALGAKAVLIGRPIFWGLALGGEAGLGAILDILRRELERDMQWCGVADVKSVDASLVDLRELRLPSRT